MLEERFNSSTDTDAKTQWLRTAIQIGVDDIERGAYTAISSVEDLHKTMDRLSREAARRVTARKKLA